MGVCIDEDQSIGSLWSWYQSNDIEQYFFNVFRLFLSENEVEIDIFFYMYLVANLRVYFYGCDHGLRGLLKF